MQYISFDAHKHYTIASVEHYTGGVVREMRLTHERGVIRDFLGQCDRGSCIRDAIRARRAAVSDHLGLSGMFRNPNRALLNPPA